MTIFLSQPMGGRTDEEIQKERDYVIKTLKNTFGEDTIILDTNFNFPGKRALYYLAKSLELLDQADIAYFIEGWQNYRGCRIEHQCCIDYNIPIQYINLT